MESDHLIAALPIERRLALTYAPRRSHTAFLGLFALDAALGQLLRSTREPMLGQIRLAWWRDQLGRPAAERAAGEPVLAVLAAVPELGSALHCLVDGWEELLGEAPLEQRAFAAFAACRGEACAALAGAIGEERSGEAARSCGEEWALAELGGRLTDPRERAAVLELAGAASWQAVQLPRSLRPLRVLHALSIRSKGQLPILSRRRDILTAFRLGLLGI